MIDGIFDFQYGTDTVGIIQLADLNINSKNVAHGVFYEPTPVKFFHHAMKSIQIDNEGFTFVDFGSGKGRNLLLASHYPFYEIIGVEFSRVLHETAERNIHIYQDRRQKCFRIRSICLDAEEYALPETNLITFFFNPFNEVVFVNVLNKLGSLADEGTRSFLFIAKPGVRR